MDSWIDKITGEVSQISNTDDRDETEPVDTVYLILSLNRVLLTLTFYN